jgi:alanine racemase
MLTPKAAALSHPMAPLSVATADTLAPIPATASVVVTVDLSAIAHNYRFVVNHIGPQCLCAPVVKANAYGLGMGPVATRLFQEGARTFFVATIEEGIKLRGLLPMASVYVLNGLWPESVDEMAHAQLTPVLSSPAQRQLWQNKAQQMSHSLPALLQGETGLMRLGFSENELNDTALNPFLYAGLSLKGLMSHLACAYQPDHPYNEVQRSRFQAMHTLFPNLPASLAGSGGLFQGQQYLYNMVRPGRILYGSTFTADAPFTHHIRPVVTLQARILQIQDIPAGASIGYDQTFYAKRPTRLATLGIGYADGYFRALSNKAHGRIGAFSMPVIGRVSMDLMTVDVTDVPQDLAHTGAWVTLLDDTLTVDLLAEQAGTVSWEFLTRLGQRPFFRYKG